MKVMVCLGFTSLLLVIFFSLLAQGHGIQASNEEMVKRMGMGGRKLGAQKEMVEGDHQGTMNTGANPSAEKCDHGVKGKLNIKCELSDDRGLPSSVKLVVGKAKISSENLFGSTTSNTIAKDKYSRGSSLMKPVEATETQLISSQVSKTFSTHCNETPVPKAPLDPFETMNTDKLMRATREIMNMMNKDYQKKARSRPPINNRHIPLEQQP